ncbi:MAG: hypothetical protein J5796_04875 [Erysipelotrichaceae bacterium]|nr:hypothetical protein [Erysipelotrichaceae bacterium]
MIKIDHLIYYILQLTWGILQNIAGFLVCAFLLIKDPKRPRFRFKGSFVTLWDSPYSAGIGMFIFLGRTRPEYFMPVLVHEYGHTIQSCILGPLYFFVIGLPSYIWAHRRKYAENRTRGLYRYSDFYPERWANHLGRIFTGMKPIDY